MSSEKPIPSNQVYDALKDENGNHLAKMNSIMHTALNKVKDPSSTTPPLPSKDKVLEFLVLVKELVKYMSIVEEVVRPVCQLAFDFIERALMKHLTGGSKKGFAIKQAWPVEWSEIDPVLTSVKMLMEGVEEKFNKAMEILEQAVSADHDECTKALMKYLAIHNDIQAVFDVCTKELEKALDILKKLEPMIAEKREGIQSTALKVAVYVPISAFVAAYFFPNVWVYAIIGMLTFITVVLCLGISFYQRIELGNDLEYYKSGMISIRMFSAIGKSRLEKSFDLLFKTTNDDEGFTDED